MPFSDTNIKAATLRKRKQRERERIKRENNRFRKQRDRELKSKLKKILDYSANKSRMLKNSGAKKNLAIKYQRNFIKRPISSYRLKTRCTSTVL